MTINSSILKNLLQKAFKAIQGSAIVPALEYALVESKGGKIVVTGATGENFIRAWDDCDDEITFLAPKQLLDYLMTLPDQLIEISGGITVTAGNKTASFETLDSKDFIAIPKPGDELATLSGKELRDVVSSVLPFAINDDLSPQFSLLSFSGEKCLASNRYAIGSKEIKTLPFAVSTSGAKILKEIEDGEITIHQSERHTHFVGENMEIISLSPISELPKVVDAILMTEQPISFEIDKAAMLSCLKRCEILTSTRKIANLVIAGASLEAKDNTLTVESKDGNFREELQVESPDFDKIYVNLKYFMPIVSACSANIKVFVKDEKSPVVVSSGDFRGLVNVISPA